MSGRKKWFFLLAAVVFTADVWGQVAPSPFSSFGIGTPYGNGLVNNQGNGLGVAQPQFWYVNNQNPALLVFNTLSVFQVGIVGESRRVRGDTISEKSTGGNLSYITFAFPIKPGRITTSAGLTPYTNLNFSYQYQDYARDPLGAIADTLTTRETGSGGLTQIYLSNGVRINDDMSVGAKISYLFGPVSRVYSTNSGGSDPFFANIEDKKNLRGINIGLGYSFSKDSLGRNHNKRLSIGATYNFVTDLSATRISRIYRTTIVGDTIEKFPISTTKGKIRLPQSFTVGAAYGKGLNWSVGTEFSYQDWSTYNDFSSPEAHNLGKSWRATVGGEYTADPLALENYLKRITLRLGATYEQQPFYANGTQVKDYGINFGFSAPTGRSSVDVAFKVGKIGNKTDNILEETYFKIYFGLTFNDQWFIKRKFD
ncbi:MAG: hypothetical protein ABI477_02260 [Chryseolinea sp.]